MTEENKIKLSIMATKLAEWENSCKSKSSFFNKEKRI